MVTTRPTDRRSLIAETGIRLIARQGVRALTHRAVDREAGIPQGSASYYAATRRALLELIVHTLADRSIDDAHAGAAGAAAPHDAEELGGMITELLERLATRADDMRARYALLLELDSDDDLRAALAAGSPVQQAALPRVRDALIDLGSSDPAAQARDLLALADALVMRTIVTGIRVDPRPVLVAFLRGTLQR